MVALEIPESTTTGAYQLVSPEEFAYLLPKLVAEHTQLALDTETTGLNTRTAKLVLIQIAPTPDFSYIVDCRHLTDRQKTLIKAALEPLFTRATRLLIHNAKYDLEVLSATFDLSLRHIDLFDTQVAECLLLGGQWAPVVLDADDEEDPRLTAKGVSLAATLARRGLSISKEERKYFPDLDRTREWDLPIPDNILRYAALDTCHLHPLCAMQESQLEAEGMELVRDIEMTALLGLAEMEQTGWLIDRPGHHTYIDRQQREADGLEKTIQQLLFPSFLAYKQAEFSVAAKLRTDFDEAREDAIRAAKIHYDAQGQHALSWLDFKTEALHQFYQVAGDRPPAPKPLPADLSLTSPSQLLKALQLIGIDLPGTSKPVLKKVRGAHPVIRLISDWKLRAERIKKFGDDALIAKIEDDERIHPSYWQIVSTGRTSASNPNIQQMPSRDEEKLEDGETDALRKHFIAADGQKLICSDFSNVEMRIVAQMSQDPNMLALFRDGGDMHSYTARLMFGLSADQDPAELELSPGLTYRKAAKELGFGLFYGMGASRLAERLEIPISQAQELMRIYFSTYPQVRQLLDSLGEFGIRNGYSISLAGRRRKYTLPPVPKRITFGNNYPAFLAAIDDRRKLEGDIRRAATNMPIQASAADILKYTLGLLLNRLPESVRLVGQIHDEIVLEAPDEIAQDAGQILAQAMYDGARHFLPDVALPEPTLKEVFIGQYWGHAK